MLPYPHFPTRLVHDLSGIWDFAFLGAVDLDALNVAEISFPDHLAVPGVFDATPTYAGKRGVACYRTEVTSSPGSHAVLRFGACGFNTRVFVDGQLVGRCDLPYSGFTVEVPVSPNARRTVVVAVDNRYDRIRQPLIEIWYDFYGYGGIYRDVVWSETAEPCFLDRVRVQILDAKAGRIRLQVLLRGRLPRRCDLSVACDDQAEMTLNNLEVQDAGVCCEVTVPNPQLWSPEHPHLHTVRVGLGSDAITERFGLRTVAIQGKQILLNGQALKLKGYCRHEAHAQFGPALPVMQMLQDLQILRDMGCNFIRGSHYPQDQRFLDLCDEMGFLVWEEALGWGYKEQQWTAPGFAEGHVDQTARMVANSYNHPSVIIWGFLNEGGSHLAETRPIYEGCFAAVRQLDRSRPVTYASNRIFDGGKDQHLDLADLIALNMYPGWYAIDREQVRPLEEIVPFIHHCQKILGEMGQGDKPFIISEIGAAALYGWRDQLHAHYSEEYQAEYLQTVCQEVMANDGIAGVAIWQFSDCRTYSSALALGRPRTFNNKGSLDEYRRPKQAVQVVKAIFRGK